MRMLLKKLQTTLPHLTIHENMPLSRFCTLGTGGEAEIFAVPSSVEDMRILFALVMNEKCPVYILGGGSNVLFPDGVITGVVISTQNLTATEWISPTTADIASGIKLSSLMQEVHSRGLGGLEFAAGIPGTLGGALAGNAGAGGHGVCELVEEVTTVESDGSMRTWPRDEIACSYRHCSLADEKRVILSARMTFREAQPEDSELLQSYQQRRKNQPHGLRNAGCTFKNPEGTSAGKLLDECGCKGLCVGGAVVSDIHANFILNKGGAKSSDVMELVRLCAKRVYDGTGILLEPEIKILDPCFSLQ